MLEDQAEEEKLLAKAPLPELSFLPQMTNSITH